MAVYEYIGGVLAASPPPNLTQHQILVRNRRLRRFLSIGIAIAIIISIAVALLTGKFRSTGNYDFEIIMMQIFLLDYTVCLLIMIGIVWYFGVKIQRLVRQRATILEQFSEQDRSSNLPPVRYQYSMNRDTANAKASLNSSAERMYFINYCFFGSASFLLSF
ncbi:hypothetical protein BDF19DRAFT_49846 [Syncephalis fuscata]|nr:hypothetical protein BDF19DRAFT_49846 [Syncephalis fuscata]